MGGTTMQIMRWKSMTAGAADPELDFDGASGAFILKDVAVSDMNSYTKAGMPKMTAMSPTANPTQMPTATPTAAPTAVDVLAANLIPIAAGGGGGLILIIIIINLIVLVLS